MDATQFLSKIFEYAERGYTQIFTIPKQRAKSIPVSDFRKVQNIINGFTGLNIYFSPGIAAQSVDHKWAEADIIGFPAAWVDIDIYSPGAHARDNLPRSVQEAMSLLPEHIPPSIIVWTGYGIHAWWLFSECWYFDTPEEKKQAQELLARLQEYIRQRAGAVGWHLDTTSNIDRVMRVPGTLNYKPKMPPVQAQVIEVSDYRYNPSDLLDQIPVINTISAADHGRERKTSFERRPTDGPAAYMLHNCMFMQHVQLNAKTISYGEWLAALTNIVRANDGIQAAHAVSAMDPVRYNPHDCDKKIDECLQQMNPQNCEYIRRHLGFQGCPPGGCGVQAPCGWSLGKLPQARALVRSIAVPTPEVVYQPEILTALNMLKQQAPAEFDVFFQRCSGQLNKNTLRQEMAKARRETAAAIAEEIVEPDNSQEPEPPPDADKYISDIPVRLRMPKSTSNYVSWIFNKTGKIMLKRVSDRGETYQEASYTPVIIAERIYNIDTQTEKAVVIFRDHRGTWRPVVLPKSTIFDARKIMCMADYGLTINSEMAKNLSKWLSALEASNADLIANRLGVAKLGWRSHDSEFVCPGLNNNYVLDVDDQASKEVLGGFGTKGDYQIWLQTMQLLRTRPKARFILAASFAAPLLKLVGQRIFAIHNWGTSRDGKTATLYAALSVWGHPGTLKITANSSQTGIERTAALCTDLPLGINEYETLSDKKKQDVVDPIIYMLSEGKGRRRGTGTGLQQTATWRTVVIMNGENPLINEHTKGGIVTRVMEIYGGPLADDQLFASNIYRVTDKNYGHAGKLFIENLLAVNHTEIQQVYDGMRCRLREKYPERIDAHLDAIACVALADQLAGMWIFGEEKSAASYAAVQMAEYIIAQLVTREDADDSERAWQWLQGWIAANEGRFGTYAKTAAAIVGYTEDSYIYILKTELAMAMRQQGYAPEKIFRRWAEQRRIPVTQVGEKQTFGIKHKRINGVQPWLIRVKAEF
ncbi:MAG: DUF927 domain-containing protein [Negativicutes bacterium]|nr:DUF927 domain-containing protein [Negativicutes bacterium]